jgi:transcriptional regulator with XRE-family HTH domain
MDMTCKEWEEEIGRQLRALRLRKNIGQQQLAAQAGIALNAVKRLESGKGSALTSLIKVLRSLGRTEWLGSLSPQVSISPMQMLKSKNVRLRASRGKNSANA